MAKTKIFFDLEFTSLHKLTTSISIALVAEDGREYYAEFTDFDKFQVNDFIKNEVLSKRILENYDFEKDYDPDAKTVMVKGDTDLVYETMLRWLQNYEKEGVEMWGDVMAYDWVLFIDIFGNAFSLPKFIDYIPMDLSTALALLGEDKDVDREEFAYGHLDKEEQGLAMQTHNALFDARTQLEVYKRLLKKASGELDKEIENTDESEDNSNEESISDESKEIETGLNNLSSFYEEAKKRKLTADEFAEKVLKNPKFYDEEIVNMASIFESTSKDDNSNSDIIEDAEFIEPTQEMVDSSEEFNPDI